MIMATSVEESFLQACKDGDLETVRLCLGRNVDVNLAGGWPLRRAVRYNHPHVWQHLLDQPNIQANLANKHGLTALHTAARFNVPQAAKDVLQRPDVKVNSRSQLGCSPVMVAAKYASLDALQVKLN